LNYAASYVGVLEYEAARKKRGAEKEKGGEVGCMAS